MNSYPGSKILFRVDPSNLEDKTRYLAIKKIDDRNVLKYKLLYEIVIYWKYNNLLTIDSGDTCSVDYFNEYYKLEKE